MTQMMKGPVTVGTAAGLMQRLGVKDMGGKTGTTNNNADFWFMGYTPELLAGTWVGCDDRFIQIESAAFYGGTAARPIWEAFFKKALADKSLGLNRNAEFVKPADLENELLSADDYGTYDPAAVDSSGGTYNAGDYEFDSSAPRIPIDSRPPDDEDEPKNNKPKKDSTKAPKIGEMTPPKKEEKQNIFKRIFNKKDKDKKNDNDY
jgi:penicillin-binding protein 1A